MVMFVRTRIRTSPHLGVSRIFVGCECRVPSVAKNRAVMFATCCRDRLVTVGHRLRLVRSAPLTRRAMVHPLAKALSGNHLSRGYLSMHWKRVAELGSAGIALVAVIAA